MLNLSFAYCATYFLILTELELRFQINRHSDLVLSLFSGLVDDIIETFNLHLCLEVFFFDQCMPFYLVQRVTYAVLSPSSRFQVDEVCKFHHFTTFLVLKNLKNIGFNTCLHKTINNLPLYIKLNK